MTSRKITIQCGSADPYWVDQFNNGGYCIIMACVFSEGNDADIYNVAASTGVVAPFIVIALEEKYQITGSSQSFLPGAQVMLPDGRNPMVAISGLESIEPQQEYVLRSWSTHYVEDDESLQLGAFAMRNTVIASTVITMLIGGQYLPVYITPLQLPPGKTKFAPDSKIALWFQPGLTQSTMITMDQVNSYTVDMSGAASATVSFDKEGQWHRIKEG